jgi:hypothetical protein
MNKAFSIQLKAAFLVLVFGLNTVVGFACAIGIDMGFNADHHHTEATANHVHAHGTHHHHHKNGHGHSHAKDNCCKGKVAKISQADKAVPQTAKLISPVFFVAFAATYYNIGISPYTQIDTSIKYFVRSYHPPIPDIRIAIQSFQI